jgi:hypothetical protein
VIEHDRMQNLKTDLKYYHGTCHRRHGRPEESLSGNGVSGARYEPGTFGIRSSNRSTAVIFNIKATCSKVNDLFLHEFV